jgi:hypothetical protein
MKDSEILKLFEKYKADSIVSALYSQFIEIASSLDHISLLSENDPHFIKMKEEAKHIKRKTITVALARFAEIESKKKINKYATVACAISLVCASFAFYQNFRQQLKSVEMKSELYSLVNEQIEQSSQLMLDKMQTKIGEQINSAVKTKIEAEQPIESPLPAKHKKHRRHK